MMVYLVWYGYEDIEGVFLNEENAKKYVEQLLTKEPYRRRDNFSIIEEEVGDA